MADGVLGGRLYLAEGEGAAFWHEDRIIAEAFITARRPDQAAFDPALEHRAFAAGTRQRECAHEGGAAIVLALQRVFDLAHGDGEILSRPGPAGGVDAGRTAQRRDREAGIVGQRRQPRGFGRCPGLQGGILGESGAGFLGFNQAQGRGADGFDAVGRNRSSISRTLPGLWLAITSLSPALSIGIGPSPGRSPGAARCRDRRCPCAPGAATPGTRPR